MLPENVADVVHELIDVWGDIIAGGKKVFEWPGFLKAWQRADGNALRDEQENACAAMH